MKLLALLLVICLMAPLPAQAATCRQIQGHNVCILSIKRSAKHHWEYRVALSVDGVARSIEKYDCRARTAAGDRIRARNPSTTPALLESASQWICGFFRAD